MTNRNDLTPGLTKYASASLPELATISFPLMLASLSGLLMNFCDRIILAQYSTDAMNAAVTAGMAANVFSYGALGIALIAEVFVGQKNGAGDYREVAKPVWQMVWFSLITAIVFVPCALLFAPLLVPTVEFQGQAIGYFKIWMLFGPAFPLCGALSAFFIGIGRVKIITAVTIIGNAANILLGYAMVFGIGGAIPPMGVNGAALATGISQLLQVAILASVFLNQANRERYGTDNFGFSWPLFKRCLSIGAPNAIGHMIEIAGWAVILRLMAMAGTTYITVLAIGQNLTILFAFASEGLQKGVISIAANLIGANTTRLMTRLIRSSVLLLIIIVAILFFPLAIYPDPIVGFFLRDEFGSQSDLFHLARKTGVWIWLYFLLDGLVWVMAGVLTAHGDTKFIMVANAIAAWCFAVMPTYVAINIFHASPHYAWAIMNIYALLNASFFIWRVRYMRKKHI